MRDERRGKHFILKPLVEWIVDVDHIGDVDVDHIGELAAVVFRCSCDYLIFRCFVLFNFAFIY